MATCLVLRKTVAYPLPKGVLADIAAQCEGTLALVEKHLLEPRHGQKFVFFYVEGGGRTWQTNQLSSAQLEEVCAATDTMPAAQVRQFRQHCLANVEVPFDRAALALGSDKKRVRKAKTLTASPAASQGADEDEQADEDALGLSPPPPGDVCGGCEAMLTGGAPQPNQLAHDCLDDDFVHGRYAKVYGSSGSGGGGGGGGGGHKSNHKRKKSQQKRR